MTQYEVHIEELNSNTTLSWVEGNNPFELVDIKEYLIELIKEEALDFGERVFISDRISLGEKLHRIDIKVIKD